MMDSQVQEQHNGTFNLLEQDDDDEDDENRAKERSKGCLTFTVDILSEDMEDITSNCLNVQDKLPLMETPTGGGSLNNTPVFKKKKKAEKTSKEAKRSQSFHTPEMASKQRQRIIPRLELPPEDSPIALPEVFSPSPIEINVESSGNGSGVNKKRKRRRSIVNLLFPKDSSKKTECTQPLLTPTIPSRSASNSMETASHHHGGQKLHFRRLSEIICRPRVRRGSRGGDLLIVQEPSSPYGNTPVTPSQPLLGTLFPHGQRRRSSVSHLDHTEQFHETKSEYLEATRRRMSSFPPSDGDESAIMLERIHYLSSLEGDENSRAVTPVSETPGPLTLLKKSLGLPSPTSGCCSPRWKSASDIANHDSEDSDQGSYEPSFKGTHDSSGQNSMNLLPPSLPMLSTRRKSSPLVPELNALREAEQRDKRRNSGAVVVFPKRKVEDVPGIFIPKSKDEDLGTRISQFLGVKEDTPRRRRHSVSDPALLNFGSPKNCSTSHNNNIQPQTFSQPPQRPTWLANLTPRSPYASPKAVLPFPQR